MYENKLNELNIFIKKLLYTDVSILNDMLNHIQSNTGKQMRAQLVFATAETLDILESKDILHLAVCIELLHLATLIHDDVIDNSTKRRNKITSHIIWDNTASILLGDYLFTKSFETMLNISYSDVFKQIAFATSNIAKGELEQLENIGNTDITIEKYNSIIDKKTGALFLSSVHCSCIIANCNDNISSQLINFSYTLGQIFQVIDDTLDYMSNNKVLDKNIGTDFNEGKLTLPIILLMKYLNNIEKKEVSSIFKQNKNQPNDFQVIEELIAKYNIIDKCLDYSQGLYNNALNNLKALGSKYNTHPLEIILNQSQKRLK